MVVDHTFILNLIAGPHQFSHSFIVYFEVCCSQLLICSMFSSLFSPNQLKSGLTIFTDHLVVLLYLL